MNQASLEEIIRENPDLFRGGNVNLLGEAEVEGTRGEIRDRRRADRDQALRDTSSGALEMARYLPYIGDAIDVAEVRQAARTGKDFSGEEASPEVLAGMSAAGLLVPNIIEKPLKRGFRAIKNALRRGDKAIPGKEAMRAVKGPVSRVTGPTNRPGDLPIFRKTDGVFQPVFDEMVETGRAFDRMKVGIDPNVKYSIEDLGEVSERKIVRVRTEDGPSQIFYRSTGYAGKVMPDGSGTQGLWQPFGGLTDGRPAGLPEGWFMKTGKFYPDGTPTGQAHGFDDYYGSESFKAISDQIDSEFMLKNKRR
jgi:hypothetical protein